MLWVNTASSLIQPSAGRNMIQSNFSTLEQWMLSFDLPSVSVPYAQYSSEDKKEPQLVFTLHKTQDSGLFHFYFFKAQKLKHHQYGLLSEVSLEQIKKNIALNASPRESDLAELIYWYKKHFKDPNSPTYQHFQSFLFKELLSTGKLCWQGTFPMKITPASPQPLIFSWLTQKNGHKKLQLKINGINKNWCLAPGSELYYIDLDRYLSGPIETSLSREQIEKFKQLPDIPPTELQKFCRFLRNNHDFHSIPFPEEITEKNIHVPPIPYLNIELTYQDQEPVAVAELFFLYEQYKVRPIKNAEEAKSNIYSFEEHHQLVDIHRHLLTERHYEQSLKAHDFQINLSDKQSGIFLMKGEGASRFERENQFFVKWNTFESDSIPHLKTLHWKVLIHNSQLGVFHTPSKITISVNQIANDAYAIDMNLIVGDQKIPFLDRLKKWLALSDSILNQKEMIEYIDPDTRVKVETAEIAPFLLFLKETNYFEKEQPSFDLSAENVGFLQHVLLHAPDNKH
jgi:hypothetical protein